MPLYACQPPTGYKDTADAWVNTGALVNRMNIALALAGNRMRGIAFDDRRPAAAERDAADAPRAIGDSRDLANRILNGDVSESTRATIARATTPAQMTALTLGSPEFQRR